jgi:hypothetical protein
MHASITMYFYFIRRIVVTFENFQLSISFLDFISKLWYIGQENICVDKRRWKYILIIL